MFRAFALLLTLTASTACGPVVGTWNEARLEAFFESKLSEFDALAEKLDEHPGVIEVSYCPPDVCVEETPRDWASQEEILAWEEQQSIFEPLLRDLGLKGQIWFERLDNGVVRVPNFGHYRNGENAIGLSLIYVPEGTEPSPRCTGEETDPLGFFCSIALKNGWHIERDGVNMASVEACSERITNCYNNDGPDCSREALCNDIYYPQSQELPQ